MPSTDAYRVVQYDPSDGGYPVHFFYPLDSGIGEGNYRVAGFVCEEEAQHYASFCNRQLEKHDTNDINKWDWA